ncbi:MAG: family 1 glycosylhydrolase, partial [Candidatus Omnitrophica bacterium]|nr:family 1 glycosylhydrolase [Candidatus Omnitrophota bacterium]
MIKFPENFLWGAATSAYQVEGDNSNSDWWEWEIVTGQKDRSGKACRHYDLFEQDFDIVKNLNHNAHRLSIEWARIQPQEGIFSDSELAHYFKVILALKERNIEPVVTLHHFTNPIWFSRLGGWENKRAKDYFLKYSKKVIELLGKHVRFWVTINEPMVLISHGYVMGQWPPQKKSFLKAWAVTDNMADAHVEVYRFIHEYYKSNNLCVPQVSIAHNMMAFVASPINFRNNIAVNLRQQWFNLAILDKLAKRKSLDYIGLNYYTRSVVDVGGWGLSNFSFDTSKKPEKALPKNTMGWDICPEGLYSLLIGLKKYNLPVFILENGICTPDDNQRWDYIHDHLLQLRLAIDAGVNVLGYLYWS